MGLATVDVIIPSFYPDRSFRDLIKRLSKQSYPVSHILIVNTEESGWDDSLVEGIGNAEVFHITRRQFDHAGTRNMGAGFSDADYLIFMTQDAVPADEHLILHLLEPFEDPVVKACYARQLPKADCRIPEGFVRSFNYPPESHVRGAEDLSRFGVKTFFCSNVCAAYDGETFRKLKGFSVPAIFNEDMIYAGRLIALGFRIAYAAEAEVYHSHNYTNRQQFRRNFDNGVSQAMHAEIFAHVPSVSEGGRLVRYVSRRLIRVHRGYLLPGFWLQCAFRLAGFRLGCSYQRLPARLVRRCSMNPVFWDRMAKRREDAGRS